MAQNPASDVIKLPFLEEFTRRRQLVLEKMRDLKLDAIVITSVANIYYTTGLPNVFPLGLFGLVLRSDGEGFWIGRRTELSNARAIIDVIGWSEVSRVISDDEDPYEAFADGLFHLVSRSSKIGFEMDSRSFPPRTLSVLVSGNSGIEIVNGSGIVESFRAVKTHDEIGYLRTSGQMTAEMTRAAVGAIVEGVTDSKVTAAAFGAAAKMGCDYLPIVPLVTSGPRSALAHASFASVPIRRGELIGIELTSSVARYCTPCFRIAMIGKPSDDLKRFHDASASGLHAAIEQIKPGMMCHEADAAVRSAITRAGYLEWFPVRAGYSVGLGFVPTWDEDHIMNLRPNDRRVIKPGMVFHIVPALYKVGVGVACCSNTLLVTDAGVEPLVPLDAAMMIVE